MIKLLALDLDGTLLNSSGKISDANKQAIQAAEKKGVLVTIATGRRFRDARPVALEIELNAPVVCHNGALLKYAESLETVSVELIDTNTVFEILRVGKSLAEMLWSVAIPIPKELCFTKRFRTKIFPCKNIWLGQKDCTETKLKTQFTKLIPFPQLLEMKRLFIFHFQVVVSRCMICKDF